MEQPNILRYADLLRYDSARGVAALDWRELPDQLVWAAFTSAESLAHALADGLAGGIATTYLAGYGLALAGREWADRPTEARRAAIIQAGEWLRQARPHDYRMAAMIELALAHADAAILAGADAERALAEYVGGALSRADRAAERCGRVAAGLLDDADHILTHGYAGPALAWMLTTGQPDGARPVRLSIVSTPWPTAARMTAAVAARTGVVAQLLSDPAELGGAGYTLCLIGAEQIALDGSVAAEPGAADLVALARQAGIPCYALSADGPDPARAEGAQLAGAPGDVIAPEHVSAIITHRGIYRPAMIARFLGDGDAPLDVIPLRG